MTNSQQQASILILGATGAVGQEMLRILAERRWPANRLRLVASETSAGREIDYCEQRLSVMRLSREVFHDVGLVLSAASAEVARTWLPHAVEAGATVIDNSSCFRHHADVPLVIPEVNGSELLELNSAPRLIANPNCSTILLLVAVNPLRQRFGLKAIDVCTYQAVSGAGLPAIEELRDQAEAHLSGQPKACSVFPEPCAFNVFNHESAVDPDTGLNGEEQKMIGEARRIFSDPELAVTPTCVRVPVFRAHSQAVTVTLAASANLAEVHAAYAGAPGLRMIDNREQGVFPTPLAATGQDEILVGRFRPDPAALLSGDGRTNRWCLFLSGDQLRKGAALNAIQIGDLIGWNTKQPAAPKSTALKQRSPKTVFAKNGIPESKQPINPAGVDG